MKQYLNSIILPMIIGMIIGSIVTGFAVNNSFHKEDIYGLAIANKYERLIQRIAEDNPTYVDDVLCETDEWYEVYGEGAE